MKNIYQNFYRIMIFNASALTKQMNIEHKKKACEVACLIKKDTCMLKLG